MRFSLLTLSLLSLGGFVAARPGHTISIEIDLDDYTPVSPKFGNPNGVSCRFNPIEICDDDGEIEFDGADCPKYCECSQDGLKCKAAEGPLCNAAAITRFCENIAVCTCSPAEKSKGLRQHVKVSPQHLRNQKVLTGSSATCPEKDPFEVECGKDFTSTKDCPDLCSCSGGALVCKHSEDCDKASVEFMCGADVAGCHC